MLQNKISRWTLRAIIYEKWRMPEQKTKSFVGNLAGCAAVLLLAAEPVINPQRYAPAPYWEDRVETNDVPLLVSRTITTTRIRVEILKDAKGVSLTNETVLNRITNQPPFVLMVDTQRPPRVTSWTP